MEEDPSALLARLQAGTATPSWVDIAGYAFEKVHTNVLAAAMRDPRKAEARRLAVALWNLSTDAELQVEQVTDVWAGTEIALKRGPNSRIDLLLRIAAAGREYRLGVEAKVDTPPGGGQLASMAEVVEQDEHARLVLLALGAAQVARIERADLTPRGLRRLTVADLLKLADLVEAASPAPDVARAWRRALELEDLRRRLAHFDEARLGGCGYRDRLLLAYRYGLAAEQLAAAGETWEVSLQRFGVVLHGESSHHEIEFEGGTVTLYLEVADQALKIKAGAWYETVDPRRASAPLLPIAQAMMASHGFRVEAAKQRGGDSVSLLTLDPGASTEPFEAFVERLTRASVAWRAFTRAARARRDGR